eukprot:TRINITY_DN43964_c0_g1_i1.p1 TRINITY_DN43964_c0_g1~~TRINITY_DN43964_c0_g1_i1.p1  ORF type:complete len:235 (+),score=39.71 TRINITY_DN43964_c0_g1_i1:124-828(+)
MIRRPPRSTLSSSSAASDVYKRQTQSTGAGASEMGSEGREVRRNRFATIQFHQLARWRACSEPAAPVANPMTFPESNYCPVCSSPAEDAVTLVCGTVYCRKHILPLWRKQHREMTGKDDINSESAFYCPISGETTPLPKGARSLWGNIRLRHNVESAQKRRTSSRSPSPPSPSRMSSYENRGGSDLPLDRVPSPPVSYTHLRAHETPEHLVCRLLLEKKNILTEPLPLNHSNVQ